MRERVVQKHFSQAPEQNDWQEFKPLFGGGKIKICDTVRAVTPFGGLSVFIEFLGRIGLVERLASITLLSNFLLRGVFFCKMAPWSGTADFGNAALSDSKRSWCRWSRRWAEVS